MQSCMFGGDKANIVSETFDSLCGSYMMCVFVLFIEQSQLPRGETALRVFAQQVGPHQAADSRFWPATGAGLELRAQHTKSTLISIESGVTNQVGGCVWTPSPLSYCLQINSGSPTSTPPTPTPTPLSMLLPHSFLLSFSSIPLALLLPAIMKILLGLYPSRPLFLFYFFCFYFIFSLSSCGISNHWTSGRGYLHVWRFCFFSGWGRASTLLTFWRALLLRQKKRTKKVFFERHIKY